MSDVASMANDGCRDDLDDETSISSRASSRIFDADNLLNMESLHHATSAIYDTDYDSQPQWTDDDGGLTEGDHHLDNDYFDDFNLENIRSISENITRNFGQPKNETENESDV